MSKKRSAHPSKKAARPRVTAPRAGKRGQPGFAKALIDPEVPVDEGVAALLEFHEGRACRIPLAAMVAHESGPKPCHKSSPRPAAGAGVGAARALRGNQTQSGRREIG